MCIYIDLYYIATKMEGFVVELAISLTEPFSQLAVVVSKALART